MCVETYDAFWWKHSDENQNKTYYGDFGKSLLMLFCQWIYKWVKEKHLVLLVLMGRKNNNNKNTHWSSESSSGEAFLFGRPSSLSSSRKDWVFTRTPLLLYPSQTRSSWFYGQLYHMSEQKNEKNGRITGTCFHVGFGDSLTTIFQRNAQRMAFVKLCYTIPK